MKFTKAYIPTLRDDPKDADVISHKFLTRAGFIRKLTSGIYNFLPLGLRSLKKIENIVREEMDAAGALEIEMPHLIPAELWIESGRWQKYGPELLRIKDRHEREYCFGPTHEEIVCDLIRNEIKSYRDFPKNIYQIQTKFRDEIRPRFGLMRGREFLMKDAYSFHTSVEDLDREYQNMHETYSKIFKRCGLASRAVEADTGNIGGSSSHEFMVLAETGEDAIASCGTCGYTANLEMASYFVADMGETRGPGNQAPTELPPLEQIHTPGKGGIDDVTAFLKIKAADMIKCLIYYVDSEFVMVCLTGDREVNEVKLGNALECKEFRLATDDEITKKLSLSVGFISPIHLKTKIKIVYDGSIRAITSGVTGANKKDYHVKNVSITRDLKAKNFIDVSVAKEGDPCAKCKDGKLKILRGIEVGHIFKLGTVYSKAMKVTYLGEDGKEDFTPMGCYGIGVSRTLAAAVEQNNDVSGIVWPKAIAPYHIHLLTMGPEDEIHGEGEKLYKELQAQGFEILWDDRNERPGVKFKDADLIGLPLQIVLGKKSLEKNEVEFKIRRDNKKGSFARKDLREELQEIFKNIL